MTCCERQALCEQLTGRESVVLAEDLILGLIRVEIDKVAKIVQSGKEGRKRAMQQFLSLKTSRVGITIPVSKGSDTQVVLVPWCQTQHLGLLREVSV